MKNSIKERARLVPLRIKIKVWLWFKWADIKCYFKNLLTTISHKRRTGKNKFFN